MNLPTIDTRYLFFTGKGGVGKTSLSCATGLSLAQRGKKVLIVSTDPASNLSEVLGTPVGQTPTPIAGAPGLFALDLDPRAAAAAYRERMVAPYRGILPEAAIQSMEEQFSGACTVEIAAFDEFARLLADSAATAGFDHIIFDTAPTGHTLRLLTLPSAWDEFIASAPGGASCLGPLAGLQQQRERYAATVARLGNRAETTLVLVSRPERAALREAERTRVELTELGIRNLRLVINGLFADETGDDAIAHAMAERHAAALATIPPGLAALPQSTLPFLPRGTTGLAGLQQLLDGTSPNNRRPVTLPEVTDLPPGLSAFIDELARQDHGVVLTMGKGGVGKTSVAAAIALALAERGKKVTLSTTDPAAHLADALAGETAGLTVTRIDPAAELARYTAEVLEQKGKDLTPEARAMLEEDLRSPCTEEIAVFRAFAHTVAGGTSGFVVLDTAPTGHTILLLDATEAYHREVLRTQGDLPEAVRELLPRLRDPDFTHVCIVTLPESTPVSEAEALEADLERAGIHPFGWVINQSLLASGTRHPCLAERAAYELPFIRRVQQHTRGRCVLIPWFAREPVGRDGLRRLIETGEKSHCCATA